MATLAALSGSAFDALPYEEGRRWELLRGDLIPVSSPTPEHQLILQRILLAFLLYLDSHPTVGLAFIDLEFAISENSRVRPDVLVLSRDKALHLDMKKIPIHGAPDLAVEVISTSARQGGIEMKLESYLESGTREVWQVFPRLQRVIVHAEGRSLTLQRGDGITTTMLPGFSLDVEKLFASLPL